jgi:sortase A
MTHRHLAVAERPATRRSRGDWVRFGLRGLGQTLITLGVVLLLLVVYEVWITNIWARRDQAAVHRTLEQQWSAGQNPLALPGGSVATIPAGTGIANLYLPRLGQDYAYTVVQGTSDADLEKGPGHYDGTALPGAVGNFAVAGHRVGKGEPFLNLDHLRPGDAVVVETLQSWFVYRVRGDVSSGDLGAAGSDGVPGREIVDPGDGGVIAAYPDHPGRPAAAAYLTLTTCDPKFSATHRLVVHALLDPSLTAPRTSDALPPDIAALYAQEGS